MLYQYFFNVVQAVLLVELLHKFVEFSDVVTLHIIEPAFVEFNKHWFDDVQYH